MIKKLELINFRCFTYQLFEFARLNYIYGNNGVGKTSIFESLELISKIQSSRTSTLTDLIKREELFSSACVDNKYKIVLTNNSRKAFIGQKEIKQEKDFITNFKTITINQDDISLIKGSPKDRRDFLDIELSQFSQNYHKTLLNYRKILKQRNILIKTLTINSDFTLLDILGSQLCKYGLKLIEERIEFINLINSKIEQDNFLDKGVSIEYLIDTEKEEYLSKMLSNQKNDILYQSTQIGPHKDDFLITYDTHKAISNASSGTQKLIIILIKFTLCNLLNSIYKDNVVLMIDDCFSDLDENNSNKLLSNLPDVQVLISGQYKKNIFDVDKYNIIVLNN